MKPNMRIGGIEALYILTQKSRAGNVILWPATRDLTEKENW